MDSGKFYTDKPIFGLDIGFNNLKVMQIIELNKNKTVGGYGLIDFDPNLLKDGVIVDPEGLAKVTKSLFENGIIGQITTRRAAIAIPVARTYNRSITLPKMTGKELSDAVNLEAEQYIPVPIDDLYIDYNITRDGEKDLDILVVAVPRAIVDSYALYADMIGVEVSLMETTIAAAARLVSHTKQDDIPTIIVDVGSISIDITVFDNELVVTGTVDGGSDTFTRSIAKTLGVNDEEAYTIKTKYGLNISKKQTDIITAIKPTLNALVKEIKTMVRYYDERNNNDKTISQILTIGGGSNMPGLSDYLTNNLRLPTRMFNPWEVISFNNLPQPDEIQKALYITAAGLALTDPKDIWK